MKCDPLGDRMKLFESAGTNLAANPGQPLCVRLDGRAFHTYTKGFLRPYDPRISSAMFQAADQLVQEFKPVMGYTQSDEITLVFAGQPETSRYPFGGKFHKINSVFASVAAVTFYRVISEIAGNIVSPSRIPSFDCRSWFVPTEVEAANAILWRWFDARRNSINALAQSTFSHKVLQGKTCAEQLEMLRESDEPWERFPDKVKYGTFLKRVTMDLELSDERLAQIPEKHRPTGPVKRSVVLAPDMPPFVDVTNRVDVVFSGAEPVVKLDEGAGNG